MARASDRRDRKVTSVKPARSTDASTAPLERWTAVALAAILAFATLGEGGGQADYLMAWHGMLVLLIVSVLFARGAARGEPRRLESTAASAFTIFLVWAAIGAMRAPYSYGATLTSLELASCAGVMWVAGRLGTRALRVIVPILQCAAVAQGLWVVVAWFRGGQARGVGSFLVANHLGLWMGVLIVLSLGRMRTGDGYWDGIRRSAAILPAAAALLLSGSRGAALATLCGVAVLVWLRRRMLPSWVMRGVAVAALLFVLGAVGLQAVRLQHADPFRYHRFKIWSASLALIAERPLMGSGPGQFANETPHVAFDDGEAPLRFDKRFVATHSDALRVAAELGIPAMLALLAALWLGCKSVADRRRRGALPEIADGAIAALVAVGVHACVDNASRWPAVYLLASALAGALISVEERRRQESSMTARVAVTALIVAVLVFADIAPYLAWRNALNDTADEWTPIERMERSRRLNPLHPEYEMGWAESMARLEGVTSYPAIREAAERAVRLDPRNASFRRRAARLEALACNRWIGTVACRERVERIYLSAEDRQPRDAYLALERARFLAASGDPAGARRAVERAMAIEPLAVLPRLMLAEFLLRSGVDGDRDRAAALVDEARQGSARWAHWKARGYGAELMQPDPMVLERLQSALDAAAVTGP